MKAKIVAAVVLALVLPAAVSAALPQQYMYCTAANTASRRPGLIVTTLFQTRSDPIFVRNLFMNYLRTSYAPYGNGWLFDDHSAGCSAFTRRREAEDQRLREISRVVRPTQEVFDIPFVSP